MSPKQPITMDDIAALAKVSKPTVSRALSDSPLVNAQTKKHVLSVARKYGYAVNRNAQKLRHKNTNTIGVSIDFSSHRQNHISDPFIFELLAGVSEALGDLNKDLLLCAPNHNDTDSLHHIYSSRGADGFIFLGQGHRMDVLDEFASTGAPFVVWGAPTENTSYCVVGSDNVLGGQMAGKYFLQRRRRNFLFLGNLSHSEIYARYKGLQQVLEESGEDIKLNNIELDYFTYEAAFEAASEYLDSISGPPDAVLAYNDTAAMAFIRLMIDRGLRVPEDVSVVGYNDIPAAAFFSPPITTIRQDTYQAGKLLVKKLMQILDNKEVTSGKIKTELIVRDT
ncbi:LacI family DNA-binding transcriptional regulator [Agarilytica rhodophyticola]|uniref:LacI family DNA-binding transcriptional regulator n=1 Tax=Agarilytica rhodophyticola TaxID=1737490 RepID=UPI001C1F3B2B|nr:LacI family DNA-binding transcriptional regulator [Agarilytica rhodophyticola]